MYPNPELIVLHEALSFKTGLAYFRGQLFSGGALTFEGLIATERVRFLQGEAIGMFNSQYINFDTNQHYDGQYLEKVSDESYTYQNKDGVTGIFYSFEQGLCYQLIALDRGLELGEETVYFPDGNIFTYSHSQNDVTQYFEMYYETKVRQSYAIIAGVSKYQDKYFKIYLDFTPEGRLKSLTLKKDTLTALTCYLPYILFPDFTTKESILALEISPEIYFYDEDIDDQLIIDIFENKGINKVTSIGLVRTVCTHKTLAYLVSFSNLGELRYEPLQRHGISHLVTIDDLMWFKQQRPDCRVYLGYDEIF